MANSNTVSTYPRSAVALHWVSALLVLVEWPLGKFGVDEHAQTTELVNAAHIWIGLAVLILTVVRVILHFTGPKVEGLPMPGWESFLFKANHALLYVALLGASITGFVMLISAGTLPPFTSSVEFEEVEHGTGGELHEPMTLLLLAMFVMHVVGVVYYQLTKGRTLRRMGVPIGD